MGRGRDFAGVVIGAADRQPVSGNLRLKNQAAFADTQRPAAGEYCVWMHVDFRRSDYSLRLKCFEKHLGPKLISKRPHYQQVSRVFRQTCESGLSRNALGQSRAKYSAKA